VSLLKLVCIGKLKKKSYLSLQHDFIEKINFYHSIEIKEIKEQAVPAQDNKAYFRKILPQLYNHIKKDDYLILTDRKGKDISSRELAAFLKELQVKSYRPVFVCGGSIGLPGELKKKAAEVISFGKVTYPHKLFRIILLEQIYRALSINHNSSYHK